jgi:hypothetical protein
MANANQGRGKAAFREFKRELSITRKEVLASFASDFKLSPHDIQQYIDLVFIQYVRTINEEDLPNPQIWINRGDAYTSKIQSELLETLGLPNASPFIEPQGGEFVYETEDEETGRITSLSIPIITGSARLAKAGIVIRKRIIPPEELEEYVSNVPYPIGLEPVYEDGILKGYRLWVQK